MKDEKCPNCGASLGRSCKCEYCGTVFFEPPNAFNIEVLYSDGEKFAYDIAGELFTINELRELRGMI